MFGLVGEKSALLGVGGTMSMYCFRVRAGFVVAPMCVEEPSVEWLTGGRVMGMAGAGAIGGACLLR